MFSVFKFSGNQELILKDYDIGFFIYFLFFRFFCFDFGVLKVFECAVNEVLETPELSGFI